MEYNLSAINKLYTTGKVESDNVFREKDKLISILDAKLKNILNKDIDSLSIKDLRDLAFYTKEVHPLLLNEIIPYENLDNIEQIELTIPIDPNEDLTKFYETISKLYYIEKIVKNIGLKIKTNFNELYGKLTKFNSSLAKLTPKQYINFIGKQNLETILDIQKISELNIIPGKIIFDSESDFKNFLQAVLENRPNDPNLDIMFSQIIKQNTLKLLYIYFSDNKKTYEEKINKFIDFYNKYISHMYITKVRQDFIKIFGELFKNLKWIDVIKEKFLLGEEPDKLIRYAYIKYYPDIREIIEDINNPNNNEKLKLGFISTIALFERIYKKGLQYRYSKLMYELYNKNIKPKVLKYKQYKPERIQYLNKFLKEYPDFYQDITTNANTSLELLNNLSELQTITQYIQLHKLNKKIKKLNKKQLKNIITDTIHYNEVLYLIENDLVNIKKLSEFIDLCIPHLSSTGLLLLSINKKLRPFLSKQKLLKLLKQNHDIKYLILLEKLKYKLTNKEQEEIINLFIKEQYSAIQLAIVNGSPVLDKKYTKKIDNILQSSF